MAGTNYSFHEVPPGLLEYVKDKGKSSKAYFRYMLARTVKMFQYKNLPDTIEADILERMIQVNGIACVTKAPDGKLYAFNGNLGEKQDVYYRPTVFIIANPHIGSGSGFTKEARVLGEGEHDGVLMRNDTEWIGLTPLIARYAAMMAENLLTVRSADIMLRIVALLSAPTDASYKSAINYLQNIEKGNLGVIGEKDFMERGINMQSPPSNNGSYLTQFIELQQYLKGSFFGELGLRANYNMKREAIGQGESTLDEDAILPLCDNMLMCRQQDCVKINEMFGTEIEVTYSSAWLQNHLEYAISLVSQLNAAKGGADFGNFGTGWDENGQEESNSKEQLETEVEENDTEDKGFGEDSRNTENASGPAGIDDGRVEEAGADGARGADGGEAEEVEEVNPESRINDIHGNEMMDVLAEVVDEIVASQLEEEKKGDEAPDVDEASTQIEDTPTDD